MWPFSRFRRPPDPGFPGGLRLADHKRESTARPVRPVALPAELVLALSQHRGAPARPLVAVGQAVAKGQLLARAEGAISAPLHAPSSGTVVALEDRPLAHPSGLRGSCLVIATDGQERWGPLPEPWPDYRQRPAAQLRQRLHGAGIVGLGGAAFPTAVKLHPVPHRAPQLLIVNGAECEPYISCDDMLMRTRPGEIVEGTAILCHGLGVAQALIAVEDNKPEAAAALAAALAAGHWPGLEMELHIIPTRYPSGGERQLIQLLTGREVPGGGLPADIGVVCQNVATAAAARDAVLTGRPLISRYVTVTGEGVAEPQVREVLLGTPVNQLIQQCGGYRDTARQLLMGGPMMGFPLAHDRVPVVKSCNCLLVHAAAPAAQPASPCIRCGACHEVCPVGLLPQQLYWHAQARELERARDYQLFDCIECGCCASVCPSRIPLVQYYRFAKTELWQQQREQRQAALARDRHQARQARLAREQAEHAARLQRKKAALAAAPATPAPAVGVSSGEDRQAAIRAARQRARQRKAARAGTGPGTDD